jgi:transposase-like protein
LKWRRLWGQGSQGAGPQQEANLPPGASRKVATLAKADATEDAKADATEVAKADATEDAKADATEDAKADATEDAIEDAKIDVKADVRPCIYEAWPTKYL